MPIHNLTQIFEEALDTLPDNIDKDSDLFNGVIAEFQDVLGQNDGGAAGVFFSSDAWFSDWKTGTREDRYELLKDYVTYELSYLSVQLD